MYLETTELLLIPASRLRLQVARASRDDARLLEERSIERYSLVTLSETERHFARVVDRVAHESVAAREDERLLDAGRVVADDVDDQLDVARVLDFSEEKMDSIKVINESMRLETARFYTPKLLVDRLHFNVVERQEGFGFDTLLLHVLNAVLGRLLTVTRDGVHVLAEHFRDGHLVLLVTRLAQVNQATILQAPQLTCAIIIRVDVQS